MADSRNFDDECGDHGGRNRADEPCGRPAGWGTDFDSGKCKHHRGTNADGSSHAGNQNAVTHGAFSDHFVSHLTDGERAAFDDAVDQLDSPEGAQSVARQAAAICLLQFRRSGDERFMRRFEGLCDKFGIAPDEELNVNVSGELDLSMSSEQKEQLDNMFDREVQP
jgi:hypothetical protein